MPEGDAGHARGSRPAAAPRAAPALVVLVLVAAGAAYRLRPRRPLFGLGQPVAGHRAGRRCRRPPGSTLPAARPAAAGGAARPTAGASTRRRGTPGAGAAARATRRLGPHVVGRRRASCRAARVVYRHGARPVTPASTMKLLTTTAALEALGPDHRFTTHGRARRRPRGGSCWSAAATRCSAAAARRRTATYPARADLDDPGPRDRRGAAAAGRAPGPARLRRLAVHRPGGQPALASRDYVPDDVVSPITALWVDEGRDAPGCDGRAADPALPRRGRSPTALRRRGITVVGAPGAATAPAGADASSPRSRAPPLAQIVEHILEVSDNEGAEVLARQVGARRAAGRRRSPAAPRGVRAVLARARRRRQPATGSTTAAGCPAHDRLDPGDPAGGARRRPPPDAPGAAQRASTGLPVAGFTGSLAYRFAGRPAARPRHWSGPRPAR